RDLLVGAVACSAAPLLTQPDEAAAAASSNARFDQVLSQVQYGLLRHEPEQATILGFSERDSGPDALGRWGRYGLAGRSARRERLQQVAHRLGETTVDGLDEERAMTRAVVLERAQGWLDLEEACGQGHLSPWGVIWGFELYPVNQISGLHIGAPSLLINYHPLEARSDVRAYVRRLESLGAALDDVREEVLADAAMRPPPRLAVAGAIDVIDGFLASGGDAHPLIASLRARAQSGLMEYRPSDLDAAARALDRSVFPAYRRLRDTLAELQPNAPEALGLAARAGGQDLYQRFLSMQADTSLSAAEIHRIGLEESARLAAELDAALAQEGLRDGGVQERLAQLSEAPGQVYEDSDAGREALLSDLRDMVREANESMRSAFADGPARLPEIRRVPQFLEAYASGGGGQPPSMNGRTPGVYVINLKDMSDVARWSLPALTYHEASPGHIYEGEIALSRRLPALRQFLARSNAFAEGWAMYAEKLAGELGLYADRRGGEIGRLQSELFRAERLVVDTGLHHYGWSFEEAVARMVASGAASESVARREVVRYAVWPGQAVGYKLGMINIEAARARMRERHGADFDLRRFHSHLLHSGGLPIERLVEVLDRV
ncbi:MAG: DUF885 family protein, partial [Alphaproteobacteria bacterium]|nr:DUF885 family protein [Alphaproteobacteria bacterium]